MTESVQPAEKDLVGIKGWLLLYTIGPVGFSIANYLANSIEWWHKTTYDSDVGGPSIVFLALYLVGLYLLIMVQKPITRAYHIGLTSFMAAAYLTLAFITNDRVWWSSFIATTIWAVYWVTSKRVRATYCQDTGQGA